jgi:hypothetical protein
MPGETKLLTSRQPGKEKETDREREREREKKGQVTNATFNSASPRPVT